MDTKLDTRTKPALSSTKSIDEGFESDPDREVSTDSEQNSLVPAAGTFDVVQSTDQTGVHHTQITRRPNSNSNYSNGNEFEARPNQTINPKVTIPRAGGQRVSASTSHPTQSHAMQYNTYRRSPTKLNGSLGTASGIDVKNARSLSAEAVRMRINAIPTSNTSRYLVNGSSQQYKGSHYQPFNHSSMLQNASSLYTFYPAEGNISLYPSQYGLRYKSSHLNVQEQAPVTMWSQSIPRHSRR